jgi:hypothetical protein
LSQRAWSTPDGQLQKGIKKQKQKAIEKKSKSARASPFKNRSRRNFTRKKNEIERDLFLVCSLLFFVIVVGARPLPKIWRYRGQEKRIVRVIADRFFFGLIEISKREREK